MYEAQGNAIYCMFTRSLIMELFRDYEVHKDLFDIENKMAARKK